MRLAECHPEREYYAMGRCKRCYGKFWRKANSEKIAAYRKRYSRANSEKIAAYKQENRERIMAYNKSWRKKNPGKAAETAKRWRKENSDRMVAYTKENRERKAAYDKRRREKNPDAILRSQLRTKYGIDLEQYNEMLQEQDGRCGMCGDMPKGRRLSVDHDHKSGRIRGLLCLPCNTALGVIESKGDVVKEYLERYG